MSTAHFQEITGDLVGIIRVFENPNKAPPDDYKFFIVASITDSICTIYGMYESDINRKNARAIYDQLKKLDVNQIEWIHKGKYHSRIIS